MNILQEETRSQFNISPITQNAIDKKGLGRILFRKAILKYPDNLTLNFTVSSSEGKGNESHVTNNGSDIGLYGGYRITIQCNNIANIIPPNLLSLPLSQQISYIKEIFDKADLKFNCTCSAFYWQGNSELLDRKPPEANVNGFSGQYGTGEWDSRHNTKNRVCKHIHHVLENMDSFIPKILKDINKNSSSSTSSIQSNTLQAPQQPAGTPTPEIKSDIKPANIKAETNEETTSSSEQLDLPKLDTSNVKAKSHEKEDDTISGNEQSEPPIEEPTLAKKTKEKDLEEELPEPLEESSNLLYETIYYSSHPQEIELLEESKKKEILKKLAILGLLGAGAITLNNTIKPHEKPEEKEYPPWVYEEALPVEEYQYLDPVIGDIIEKYKGDFEPELIETFLIAESKYGKHVKYDKWGAGIAQVSEIVVKDYNQRHGTHYKHSDTFKNDDLNIKIGLWYLNWCKERFKVNMNEEPDDIDLYLMYNNGVKGYLNNIEKYRNKNFRPYLNFLNAREIIQSQTST